MVKRELISYSIRGKFFISMSKVRSGWRQWRPAIWLSKDLALLNSANLLWANFLDQIVLCD